MTKKFISFVLLAFLMLPLHAWAADTVSFGCAPWDGPTLQISLDRDGKNLGISIWMQGYQDLANGKMTVAIDNRGNGGNDTTATGFARLRSLKAPDNDFGTKVDAIVTFETLEFKRGGKASGYVTLPNGDIYRFNQIIPDKIIMCG